jgi:undecaprenyl-diphosphatase
VGAPHVVEVLDLTGPTPAGRFGARTVLAGTGLVLAAVPFGLLLFLVQDEWGPLERVDTGARDSLYEYAVAHPGFVTVMRTLSDLGSFWAYLVLFATVTGWLLWRRLSRLALFVVVTTAGSALLNAVVKLTVDRARPVLPDPVASAAGLSFPSGHAQSAVVSYAVLLLVFLPVLRGAFRAVAVAVAVTMVLGIGFSRVALGVHFVSDVLAGYVLGGAWLAQTTAAFNVWRRERGERAARPSEGLEPEAADRLAPGEPEQPRWPAPDAGTFDPAAAPGRGPSVRGTGRTEEAS